MMQKTTTYFLHGLDSSGKGTKGNFFAQNFPQVICPDFEGTLPNRLHQLDTLCKNQQQLTLIGSSFGGLMATHYATDHPEKITRLILLAPALNFEGYHPPAELLQIPTLIIVGKHDTVTPAALVIPLAEATFAHLEIRIEEDDHMLHDTFHRLDWPKILVR
ncbi:MAG: alpha/beta fold hydrolase [Desulforhopalus sp.]|nr:alpha/beta fold hydrolase [Desulforhopalus sp.]